MRLLPARAKIQMQPIRLFELKPRKKTGGRFFAAPAF
jgi:hypothetical protein